MLNPVAAVIGPNKSPINCKSVRDFVKGNRKNSIAKVQPTIAKMLRSPFIKLPLNTFLSDPSQYECHHVLLLQHCL